MVKPEVILWPDPERQWTEIMPVLQAELPHLLIYHAGHFEKHIKKCGRSRYGKTIIDADYLNNQLFPDLITNILKWICKGDAIIDGMDQGKRELFVNLCKSQYDFEPDYHNQAEFFL